MLRPRLLLLWRRSPRGLVPFDSRGRLARPRPRGRPKRRKQTFSDALVNQIPAVGSDVTYIPLLDSLHQLNSCRRNGRTATSTGVPIPFRPAMGRRRTWALPRPSGGAGSRMGRALHKAFGSDREGGHPECSGQRSDRALRVPSGRAGSGCSCRASEHL
jgi:hypothetical protein